MLEIISLVIAAAIVLLGFDVPANVVAIGAIGFFVYAVIALVKWVLGLHKQSGA